MSFTYSYKDGLPIAKVKIEAENELGELVTTEPLTLIVDTGASYITLDETLLKNSFGRFPTESLPGTGAGTFFLVKIALLEGKVHFLNETEDIIYSEEMSPLKIVIRNNAKLLGLNLIEKHIYEFNGKTGVLTISHHLD